MFSGNNKISLRQAYRNQAAAFISLAALLPPLAMGRENMGSILLALVFLGFLLAGTAAIPCPASKTVKVICYLHYWVLGSMLVRMTSLMVQEFLLTDTRLWVIMGWFCLFCFYDLYKGLECRLRVSEVLFPFFLFMLLFLSIWMYGEVRAERLWELKLSLGEDGLRTSYELFCWFTAVGGLWHLRGKTADEKRWNRTVWRLWLTGSAFAAGWSLFCYSIYGNAGHTGLHFPLASAMGLAHFPGNMIGRLDTLFVFVWVIGLFLLCSALLAPLAEGEADTKGKYGLFLLLILSFAFACQESCMEWGQKFLYYVSTPVQILLLLLYGFAGHGKRTAAVYLCLLSCLLLGGCSGQELEKQSIVTAVGVDVGEKTAYRFTFGFGSAKGGKGEGEEEEPFGMEASSFKEAEDIYREYYQKDMDFDHLKCFYFSGEVLAQEGFPRLLEEIQLDGSYSRGTYVYAAEKACEEAEKKEQPDEGMPVHRLLNAWYNGGLCEIPTVMEDGRYKGLLSWPY